MIYDLKIENLKLKICAIILISIFLSLKSVPIAQAQALDIGLYPPIFQIQTNPPSSIKVPLAIENFSDKSEVLNILLKPFKPAKTEDGQLSYINDLSSYPDPNIFQKVKILDQGSEVTSILLSPTEQKELTLEIQIPGNEPKGDYYFSIIFSSSGESDNTENSTLALGGISSNVLLSVGPQGKTQGYIQDFSSPFFVNSGPVAFNVRLKNSSDHFISPKGKILVKNLFGQTIGKVDLLPVNILSNSSRKIPDLLQSANTKSKDYEVVKHIVEKNNSPVAVWPEKFLFGPYTATLDISLSDNGPDFTKTVTFFAFPVEFLIGILAIIAIVIFIAGRVRKNLYKKA